MPILMIIGRFILVQLLQALITAQFVKDAVLGALKAISKWTKTKFDDKIYKRVKFYFNEDKSERLRLPDDNK